MTKKDFKELDLKMKLLVIKSIGNFVAQLHKDKESLLCYSIEKFFVEVIYERGTNNLLRIVSFEEGRQLDKYSDLNNEV